MERSAATTLRFEGEAELIADAYRSAALANANMHAAAEALARMQTIMQGATDLWVTIDLLNGVVNDADGQETLQPVLIGVRSGWTDRIITAERQRIHFGLQANATEAMTGWLNLVANGIGAYFPDLARRFTGDDLPFPDKEYVRRLADWMKLAAKARWRECKSLFVTLGSEERVEPLGRARVLAILAEIELLIFRDAAAAEAALRRAQELAPGDWRVLLVKARTAAENQPDDASSVREQLTAAIAAEPKAAASYVEFGRYFLKKNDLVNAEAQFNLAAGATIGPAEGFISLIQLCARSWLVDESRTRLAGLFKRVQAVGIEPGDVYEAMLAVANAYGANKASADAFHWFDRAISYDPKRHQAWIEKGYAFLGEKDFASARQSFDRAIEVAGEAVDGYWGLFNLAQEQSDWRGLLRAAFESVRRAPDWEAPITERIVSLASRLYTEHGDYDEAKLYYRCLRRFLGRPFESRFQNLSGNLEFYRSDFDAAARHYEKALEADPANGRSAANAALAYEKQYLGNPFDSDWLVVAAEKAGLARSLEPENSEYRELDQRLQRTARFVAVFGKGAVAFVPESIRLRVFLGRDLVPIATNAGQLSTDFAGRIGDLRKVIAKEAKFTIGGVNFRDSSDLGEATNNVCAVEVNGLGVTHRALDPPIGADQLIEFIGSAIRENLPALFGHREANDVRAKATPDSDGPVDLLLLNEVVRVGRDQLREARSLDLDVLANLQPPLAAPSGPPLELVQHVSDPVYLISLTTSSDETVETEPWLDAPLLAVQQRFYDQTGVVIKSIHRQEGDTPGPHAGVLRLGEQIVSSQVEITDNDPDAVADAIVALLAGHAPLLLHPDAVRFHLDVLRSAAPELVSIVELTMNEDALVAALRQQLRQRGSIRNLLPVLEDIVIAKSEMLAPQQVAALAHLSDAAPNVS